MNNNKKNHIIREALNKIEENGNWQLIGPVVKSRECNIYRAYAIKSDRTLAVKQYLPHINLAAPQQQFDAFQRYQHPMALKDAELKVPQVFFYDRKNQLLLMEWVAGKSLHHCFWIPSIQNKRNQDSLKKTGEWLRLFHETSVINTCELNFTRELKVVENRITQYSENHLSSNPNFQFFLRSYAILKQAISNLPPTNVPHAIAHGDFTPSNMLLDHERIVGLDIWASARKPIYVDLARMIVYLTIAYPLITRQLIYNDSGKIQKKIALLLKGYGKDIVDPSSSIFKLFLFLEYLRRWLAIKNRPRSIKGSVTDRYQLSQIKKQIQAVLNALSRT